MKRLCYGVIICFVSMAANSATRYQSLEEIRQSVEKYVAIAIVRKPSAKVKVSSLDSRLRLKPCVSKFSFSTLDHITDPRNLSVKITCEQPQWTLLVPVRVEYLEYVYVTKRLLPRGSIISSSDIKQISRSSSKLPASYITDSKDLIGKRAKRTIRSGTIISPFTVELNPVVKRGETVNILISSPGLEVHAYGEALSDGVPNQLIKVRNVHSRKIVEGTVTPQGTIKVNM